MSVLIGRHCSRIAVKLAEAQLKKTEELLKVEKTSLNNRLRLLDIEIDLASGTVWRAGEVVDLPDLSYRLLAALVERAPVMISKDVGRGSRQRRNPDATCQIAAPGSRR